MERNFEEHIVERAVLVGLNADVFRADETATDETLEELEALLETAGGFCTAKILQNRHTPDAHSFIGEGKAQEVLKSLYYYFVEHYDEMPLEYRTVAHNDSPERGACDYISGMSDHYALQIYGDLFVPKAWIQR